MSADNALFVFIDPQSDKNASQRQRELQRAEARAHAARVSGQRRHRGAGIIKPGTSAKSASKLPMSYSVPDVLALRPGRATSGQRREATKEVEDVEEAYTMSRDRRRMYTPSIASLGQDQVDPFDTAPVRGLDNFIYSILDFAYDYAFPSFVPAAPVNSLPTHRANRRKLGRQYGYLLEAQIVAATRFQLSPLVSGSNQKSRQLGVALQIHEKNASDLFNQEILHLTGPPPDTLIYAAALSAYTSGRTYDLPITNHPRSPLATAQNLHAMGHLDIVPERVQAVRTLVQLRGGIDELTMPFQRIVLTYLDTIVSTRLGVRPGWNWPSPIAESLQRTGEHILDQTAADLMQIIGSGFHEVHQEPMREALLLACEATVALDHHHRGGSTAPALWDVARMRVAVQHRLCSFEPVISESIDFSGIQFEICRLSVLLYSDLVLFPIPECTTVRPPLLEDLSRILDRYEMAETHFSSEANSGASVRLHAHASRDLLAWSLLLAAAASISSTVFKPRFVERLETLIRRDARLRDWEFYKALVRKYLWWDYVLDPLALEAFKTVSWQDITNQPSEPTASIGREQSRSSSQSQRQSLLHTPTTPEDTPADISREGTLDTDMSDPVPRAAESRPMKASPSRSRSGNADEDVRGSDSAKGGMKQAPTYDRAESVPSAADDAGSPESLSSTGHWVREFEDADLLQWLNVFFDRLYACLPIVGRLTLYQDLMIGRHKIDPEFASLILALCGLALVQPVFKAECGSMPLRTERAARMLSVAIRMRSFDFGEKPTFDAVITSFFLFAGLFGLGFQKAAWLRLQEAVQCGRFIGLHQSETYQNLRTEDMARRFRLFLILSVTEREYALQWNHSIRFVGQNMDKATEIYDQIETRSTAETASILVHDERDLCAMRSLLQLMKLFDSIDEEVIPCLNRSCCRPVQRCSSLTINRIRKVYDAITTALETARSEPMPSQRHRIKKSQLNDLQWAYCFILQQWLLVRLWVACLTHELLDETSQFPLMRVSFAIAVAENVLDECHQLGQAALEVHGVNMIERIYDIAMGVVMAAQYHARVSGGKLSTASVDSILRRFFELLGRLRNGESKFMSALQRAYESVQ